MVFTQGLRLRTASLDRLKCCPCFQACDELDESVRRIARLLAFHPTQPGAIVQLCLPLVILEALLQQVLNHMVGPDAFPGYSVVVGLLVYPLYTGALILFLMPAPVASRRATRTYGPWP